MAEMKEKGRRMMGSPVIFVSPIPYLIKFLAGSTGTDVYVFHNDNREKKELPDGRIIQTVAKTGWQLV